jgi:muconolactone delta-isomerase
MDYLVTMTTHVPDGTSQETVNDVRAREAARSAELTERGYLIRLWRPPLRPGEWRSIGLFAAPDDAGLKDVLASMPLQVWRTDEITPLPAHPNDPAVAGSRGPSGRPGSPPATEYLTTFTISVPAGTPREAVESAERSEARRASELAGQGKLLRLWMLPAQSAGSRALGLWRAGDAAEMQEILKSLPLDPWMTDETTPLTQHPSDPALTRA